MLTAAVRDLHLCCPGQFVTDVRTRCPELWENNPFITPLSESDPGVEVLDCSYPLINRCNEAPYHCLHGFIEFFNDQFGLHVKPSAFKGDIHLSALEKSWCSQVFELCGKNIPYWIVAGGGKYDITIKWWDARRYQEVVDRFRDKIQFVQVGEWGHHHPKLNGAVDLRGRTNLRELVRLVYHSQGVLCPVTSLMHLAAAVEVKGGGNRPCVVVAGAREPAHWESYPDHQYIHTNGAVRCQALGGCWKDRTAPLGDGNERDNADRLCADTVGDLPRCMDLIASDEVIRRIELYFNGGRLGYLTPMQNKAAQRAIASTCNNPFDEAPLTLHNARIACRKGMEELPQLPEIFGGRGIVICGGGVKYFANAWVCIRMLRHLGCRLPIQLWHLGPKEVDPRMKAWVKPHQVECVDALRVRRRFPARILRGWELKPYALLRSRFEQTLLLDADNVPAQNPEYLFESPEFESTGAVFWPDYGRSARADPIWHSCGLPKPLEPEFESVQILIDKRRCWRALCLALWFNEHSDFYYRYLHGDKDTFCLAFRMLGTAYSLVEKPVVSLQGMMCQHDFEGNLLFQHRNSHKWELFAPNKSIPGFRYERKCLGFLKELRALWRLR
jgi:hypothetical protein